MLKRKINLRNSLKLKKRKMFLGEITQNTMKTKIYNLKWFFSIVFIFIIFSIIFLFFVNVNSYFKIVIAYSLTGFLTFFMAYFGWILAQFLIDNINFKNQKNVNGVLYYFRKLKK